MKHNQQIQNQHFRKDWAKYIKTWFNQPVRMRVFGTEQLYVGSNVLCPCILGSRVCCEAVIG
jgi:hypothetical protein